jgi:hypothetical protein
MAMVKNLQFLFNHVPTTSINHYGLHIEASDEKYCWTRLVQCLLHSDAPLPERPSLTCSMQVPAHNRSQDDTDAEQPTTTTPRREDAPPPQAIPTATA